MSEFDERERAFEKKYEIDQDIMFKASSRAAHLFGRWAAEQLGMKGIEAEKYARAAAALSVQKAGRELVIDKAEKDFQAKGVKLPRGRLEKEMGGFMQASRDQLAKP